MTAELLGAASAWLIILMRALALSMTAPVLSARFVPNTVKVGLAVLLSGAAWLSTESPGPTSVGEFAVAAVHASVSGVVMGWCARAAMEAAWMAGYAASSAMGMNYAIVVSPNQGGESTSVAELLSLAALGTAVGLGLHREAVAWLVWSAVAPVAPDGELIVTTMQLLIASVGLGVRLAFPVLLAVLVGQLVWGIASRSGAQLNLSSIGFTVTILTGGGALYVVVPHICTAASHLALDAFRR